MLLSAHRQILRSNLRGRSLVLVCYRKRNSTREFRREGRSYRALSHCWEIETENSIALPSKSILFASYGRETWQSREMKTATATNDAFVVTDRREKNYSHRFSWHFDLARQSCSEFIILTFNHLWKLRSRLLIFYRFSNYKFFM